MAIAAAITVFVCHIGSQCCEAPVVDTVIETPQKPNRCTFTKEQIAAIDSIVERKCRNANFSGVVLIGQKDSVLYERACGYANIRENLPNTDTTAFQLASVSKQFTAVAILQLYERGKLRLTDSVAKYLPGFPYPDITIHQLLVHRSGLPNYHYLCDRKPMLDDPYFSNQQIVAELIEANAGRYYLPNRRFQYSNTGYAVLAAVVEAVSGLKFENYLEDNIFKPLGMTPISPNATAAATINHTINSSTFRAFKSLSIYFTINSTINHHLSFTGTLFTNDRPSVTSSVYCSSSLMLMPLASIVNFTSGQRCNFREI